MGFIVNLGFAMLMHRRIASCTMLLVAECVGYLGLWGEFIIILGDEVWLGRGIASGGCDNIPFHMTIIWCDTTISFGEGKPWRGDCLAPLNSALPPLESGLLPLGLVVSGMQWGECIGCSIVLLLRLLLILPW